MAIIKKLSICTVAACFIFTPTTASAKKFKIDPDSKKGLVVFAIKTLDNAASVNFGSVDLAAAKIPQKGTGFMVMAGGPTTIFSPIPKKSEFIDPTTSNSISISFAKKKVKPGVYAAMNAIDLNNTGKTNAGCYNDNARAFTVVAGKINLVLMTNPALDYPERGGDPWNMELDLTEDQVLEAFIASAELTLEARNSIVIAPTKRISYKKRHRSGSYLCFPSKTLEITVLD